MTDDQIREKVEEMINLQARTFQACKMYGIEHKITAKAIKDLFTVLSDILSAEEEITIGIIGDEIAYKKKPYYETSKRIKSFIDQLTAINLRKISFARGVKESEIKEMNSMLLIKPATLKDKDALKEIFKSTNIENIAIGDIGYKSGKNPGTGKGEDYGGGTPGEDYDEGMDFLAEAYENIKGNQPLDADSARQIVGNMISDIIKNKNLLLLLTSTKSHDEKMLVHGVNVAVFTLIQAEALGLSKKHQQEIGVAALLHDSGKITSNLEDENEQDIEKLSAVEKKKRAMRNINGAKILLDMENVPVLAALAAFEHDIAYDGTGVPDRLYGDKPNLASMMIAISDYYDKLMMDEEKKNGGGPEHVFDKMMELSGKKFHPDLLSNFFTLVGVYPPGTLVELNTKEVGLVIQASTIDIRRPQIEVLYDEKGEKYENPEIINLLEKDKKGDFKWQIKRSIAPDDKFEVPGKHD
jgi:HD-GYP domain-containing protein (c-di-GMP phosphodiesterase class II)